jgi:hypothetical protein
VPAPLPQQAELEMEKDAAYTDLHLNSSVQKNVSYRMNEADQTLQKEAADNAAAD